MTTLVVNRVIPNPSGPSKRIRQIVPVARASDSEFESFMVEQVREWLTRNGKITGATVASDSDVLSIMRAAFALDR